MTWVPPQQCLVPWVDWGWTIVRQGGGEGGWGGRGQCNCTSFLGAFVETESDICDTVISLWLHWWQIEITKTNKIAKIIIKQAFFVRCADLGLADWFLFHFQFFTFINANSFIEFSGTKCSSVWWTDCPCFTSWHETKQCQQTTTT